MDVISRRISLTAWGRLYGFDKATTCRLHLTGKLPPELQIEQLANGRYYVVVPPEKEGRCVVYARVSSADQKEDLDRQVGRVVEWATQQGYRPDEVVKEVGTGLNGNPGRLRRLVADHTVGTIVVEHRERLSRFGFEYVEAALAGRGARILVMDEGELEDDLFAGRDRGDDLALCSALWTAFGPAACRTSAGGGAGRLMRHPGTYQTRVSCYGGVERAAGDAALSTYAELYGRVQRKLFADVSAGRSAASLKSA